VDRLWNRRWSMGQHKYNPNCQLAKEGKLPPKPKNMSKREIDRMLMNTIGDAIMEKTGLKAIMNQLRKYDGR
jgi:hypothetical protein